ncbi:MULTISPECIES: ImmA/IrrE family metallo-endopeptidase [unclassified Crossiella]|uniref:ImmA/IrrE family metallo-endopeptidase n=1 Tax=unclassified Crossiella TaxID=2620835 RepID=UPI001FFF1D91|nr:MULTISPECIES: ImmA/IrrE family metallo-endopeptidase [unclassified Crossiella]MCK2237730.1 ImmA/IrrE family metallo-endopeptidase [Crossiella sp. S99.2]MCK2255016.1 ImmA/IrrE family metallo-endopeptidase [Crossiella sp. S99.1]
MLERMFGRRARAAAEPADDGPVVDEQGVRRLVAELGLTVPCDLDQVIARVAERRGRPIQVIPFSAAVVERARRNRVPMPFGMWLAGNEVDFIFFREDTTVPHQEHVVLHELGHLCCRHETRHVDDDVITDAAALGDALGDAATRTVYGDAVECAAEHFAYLVAGHLSHNPAPPEHQPMVDRYRRILGG